MTDEISSGWIKLYRVSIEKGWLTNPKLWTFWCYCLLKASHKETFALIGNQRVPLQPGEFIFGRKRAATDLKLTEKEIRGCATSLQGMRNIRAVKRASKYTIFSIVNWHTYQGKDADEGQQKGQREGQQGASKGPHTRSKEVISLIRDMSANNDRCPHQQIISLYHKSLPMCPEMVKWTDTRAAHLRARWNESKEQQNLAWWESFFQEIAKSKFLTGRVNGRGNRPFFASLDWIVKPENFVKILEGKYHE